METIDSLISAQWIIPVEPVGRVLQQHAVAIRGQRILDILPVAQARRKYHPEAEHDLPGHALIPGLINVHTHAAMSLLRGLADDLPLERWLREHIWPAESRWVSAEFVHDGTMLAIAEMLRSGTTCFNDMYFFPEVAAHTVGSLGMRAHIGMIVVDFPTAWARNADEYITKGLSAVLDAHKDDRLISVGFAPHALYTVSDAPLERIRTLSEELGLPVHIHVQETAAEVREHVAAHGCRPLARLDHLGLVGPHLLAVHMTQLEDGEIKLLAERGANVVHCPQSNLKLASGFCPVARLVDAGVNVALGTDGAASNNDLDMWDEMRTAALLAKGVAGRAEALPAAHALRMATFAGAKALGLERVTGSIEIGKAADLVAVDLRRIETQPVYDPISQLVYATGRECVTHVWVGGRPQLIEGELIGMDVESLLATAESWRRRLV